jgi:hypothetical protein
MAVDTVHDLQVGQWVQFIHHGEAQNHGHIDNDLSSSDIQTGKACEGDVWDIDVNSLKM